MSAAVPPQVFAALDTLRPLIGAAHVDGATRLAIATLVWYLETLLGLRPPQHEGR